MDDRELLERHAPCLRYDAQDAYRAVAASTFCDNPPNRLRRRDGTEVAAPPELSLDTLASFSFQAGDHLDAGPRRLQDAVRMQLDALRYPHCAYGRVKRHEGLTWLQYWLWYYDNPKTFLGKGRHEGDWELVQVGLDARGAPVWVTCSQHGLGETRAWNDAEREGDRPVVYVAPFSHANYFRPGTRYYFPAADHPTGDGPRGIPVVLDFGAWQRWRGRWGREEGTVLLGRTFRALGGVAPAAPVVQEERWDRPATYARKARRPATAGFKRVIWFFGRATYPLLPAIERVRIEGRTVRVAYRLTQRPWRRSRHLLVTVHRDEAWQPMLVSEVLRRPSRRGEAEIDVGEDLASCAVWASTFNALGQRSDARQARAG